MTKTKVQQYRVTIQSGLPEAGGLEFFDLSVTRDNGSKTVLRVNKSHLIPQNLVATPEFQKSLSEGSVSRCLKQGWVVAEPEGFQPTPPDLSKKTLSELVGGEQTKEVKEELDRRSDGRYQDKPIETVNVIVNDNATMTVPRSSLMMPATITPPVITSTTPTPPGDLKSKKSKESKRKSPSSGKVFQDKQAVEKGSITTYDEFKNLLHVMKLKFIKSCTNIELLKEISEKSTGMYQANAKLMIKNIQSTPPTYKK